MNVSILRPALFAAGLCAAAARLCAQQGSPAGEARSPELQAVLQHLGEQATALERALPSFTCDEHIISQDLRGKKTLYSVTVDGTLHMSRGADGKLQESYTFTKVDNVPFYLGHFRLPLYVSGGFDQALRYVAPGWQACYEYKLSPGRIDFLGRSDAARSAACTNSPGVHGFMLLDAEGNATHVQRSVPEALSRQTGLIPYSAIDLAPVDLGGETYRLARHMVSTQANGEAIRYFEVTYSGCRLYKATVTIEPAGEPPGEDRPPGTGTAPK